MPGLRSARSRAILAGVVLVVVLAGTATVAQAQQSELAADVAAADRAAATTLWLVIGLSAAAFLVAAGAAAVIASVVRPLAALRASARAVTSGEPEARAKVAGPAEVASLARDFNAMTDALAAKAQEYIDTTNLTGVIIMRVDKDNRVSLVNDAMCEFLGRSREEILGTPILDYLHPEDAPSTIRAIRRMVQSKGLVTGIVSRHVTPTGTRVTEWNGYPILDEDGRYAGVHGTGRDITQRKRAEEALRESERRYRELIDSISDVFFAMDRDLRYTYWNKASEKLTGVSAGDAIGKSLYELFPEVKATRADTLYQEVLRTRQPRSFVNEYQLEGKNFSFEISAYPSKTGLSVFVKDISERKRAEEALRKSEARYRLLAENATDVIWTMDTNLRFTYMSPSVTRLRGYTVEEAMAQTLEETLTPASLELAMKVVAEEWAIEKMEDKDLARWRTLEVENTCKDGSTVWFEVKIAFLHDEDKRPVGILGVSRDISKRKQAEEALRESEERLRSLFEASADAIILSDLTTNIIMVNRQALRLLGCDNAEEVIGRNSLQFIAPEDRQRAAENALRTLQTGTTRNAEYTLLRKDGTSFPAELSASSIVDAQGRPQAFTGVVRDISERKRAEEALRESEQRFRTLSEATFEGIAIHKKGRILDANQTLAMMFGYELSEVIGMRPSDFVAPESRDLLAYATLSRYEKPFELIGLRKDGSTFPIEACGKATLYRGRMVTVAAIRDITARKRAEEALQKVREEIEGRVERRMQQVNGYGLTFREITVLHLVAAGESDKEIATVLGISPLTAHKHLGNILEKMGAACRTEAGVRALREGLLD